MGRGVSPAVFQRNLARVKRAAGPRAFIGFQEIDEADQPEEMDWVQRMFRRTHIVIGEKTAVPILVPLVYEDRILAERRTDGCAGLAKFTPFRPINEVVVQLRPNLSVAMFDWHSPIDRPQTQSRRADVRKAAEERMGERHDQGHSIVWVSDTNHRGPWAPMLRGERRVVEAGIDRIRATAPRGRIVHVSDRRTVDLRIDGHNAHGARVMFQPTRQLSA